MPAARSFRNVGLSLAADRPFDPWRRAGTDAVRGMVAEARRMIENYESYFRLRRRRRRPADQQTFKITVEALLCDAIYRHLTAPQSALRLSLSNRVLGTANRYRSPVMSKALPDILKRLASPELAFLEITKGHQGFAGEEGKQTTVPSSRVRCPCGPGCEQGRGRLRRRSGGGRRSAPGARWRGRRCGVVSGDFDSVSTISRRAWRTMRRHIENRACWFGGVYAKAWLSAPW